MIIADLSKTTDQLKKEFSQLSGSEMRRGVRLALNDAMTKAGTALSKRIKQDYEIDQKGIRKAIRVAKATDSNLVAALEATGKPISLIYFKPQQESDGVSISIIRGKRSIIKHSFLITTKRSGTPLVVGKGSYKGGGGKFKFRFKRVRPYPNPDLPVTKMTGPSIPYIWMRKNSTIMPDVLKAIEPAYEKRLRHYFKNIKSIPEKTRRK